jgi:hypothetical protein
MFLIVLSLVRWLVVLLRKVTNIASNATYSIIHIQNFKLLDIKPLNRKEQMKLIIQLSSRCTGL